MTNSKRTNASEIVLEDTFTNVESGIELLEFRILETAKAVAELVKDHIEYQDDFARRRELGIE